MGIRLTSYALVLFAVLAAASCDDPTTRIAGVLTGPDATTDAVAPPAANDPTVVLTATSEKPLQGFTLRVEYPIARGSFAGSADGVACTSAAPGFTPNDRDDGTMLLVSGTIGKLSFPIEVSCRFEPLPGATLAASDVTVVVQSVTAGGKPADPADLKVAVTLE